MLSGFEIHGLNHSSASQINQWSGAPCAWIANKLLGYRFPTSDAAIRGTVIENAVVNILANGWAVEDAKAQALAEFNKECALNNADSVEKNRAAIEPIIDLLVAELAPLGVPEFNNGAQKKVELTCKAENFTLPIIGFIDLHYPQHKLVVDIKTTLRMPSEMSASHGLQCAIYQKFFGDHAVKFLYATPKKAEWKEIDDPAPYLAEAKTILERQERFLRVSPDRNVLASIVPIVRDSFYWNGAEGVRQEIYGL